MLGILGPYGPLIGAIALVAVLGGAYVKGRGDGSNAAEVRCQAAQNAVQRARERERADLQAALDARATELAKRAQEGADAVEQVRIEFGPAKTIIRREVAERVVYRECRVGDGMRNALNAALRGDPVADRAAGAGADGVPAGTPPAR